MAKKKSKAKAKKKAKSKQKAKKSVKKEKTKGVVRSAREAAIINPVSKVLPRCIKCESTKLAAKKPQRKPLFHCGKDDEGRKYTHTTWTRCKCECGQYQVYITHHFDPALWRTA